MVFLKLGSYIFCICILSNPMFSQYTTLAYSGKQTVKLIDPPNGPPIEYQLAKQPKIPLIPEAVHLWSGRSYVSTCPMNITIQDQILITCLQQPLILYAGADNKFNATFLGSTLIGTNSQLIYNKTIAPNNFICNGTYTFRITAVNTPKTNTIGCENKNGASLVYGVMQDQKQGCCESNNYYHDKVTCKCYPCTNINPLCVTCLNQNTCLTCTLGYIANLNLCIQVCGNAIRTANEACDDGNLLDGDGCSSNCMIETNYFCITTILELSECTPNSFRLYVKWVQKQFYKNRITIAIVISPIAHIFERIDMTSVFQQNLSLYSASFMYFPNGTLLLSYNFVFTLEGMTTNFTFDPKLSNIKLFDGINSVDFDVSMKTNSNIPIIFFSQDTYVVANVINKLYKVFAYICYGILVIGTFCNKIIGLQLFEAFQISFFSVSNLYLVHPFFTPLFQLAMLNGYNLQINTENKSYLPDRVSAISYSAGFFNNFNISLGVVCFFPVLALLLQICRFIFAKYSTKLHQIACKSIGQYFMTVSLFFAISLGYSVGLQILYGNSNFQSLVSMSVSLIMGSAVLLLLYFCIPKHYGQFSSSLKYFYKGRPYFIISFLYRLTIGTMMSGFNYLNFVSFLTFCLSVWFLLYKVSALPFRKAYHNYRSIFLQAVILFVLFGRMLHCYLEDITQNKYIDWNYFFGISQVALLGLCIVISLGLVIFQGYKKIKSLRIMKQKNPSGEKPLSYSDTLKLGIGRTYASASIQPERVV